MTVNGIDISKHNGSVDFDRVRAAGYEFVIIRAGFGRLITQKDPRFEENYAKAKAAGLKVGVYWYSYAMTPDEAKTEAAVCLQAIAGKRFEYPIYFDLEEAKQFATGRTNCSAMVNAFLGEIEAAGHHAGLYMSRSYIQTHIDTETANRWALWVAEYNSRCNYGGSYGMWQKSCNGRVDGVSGDVDLDECYVDYPAIIAKTENKTRWRVVTEFDTEDEAKAYAAAMRSAKVVKVTLK